MDLPVNPPLKPMLAKSTTKLPTDGSCIFEPKWDGFRCIIFRDGDEVVLGSRNEKPLTRYFPELIQPIRDALPGMVRAGVSPDGSAASRYGPREARRANWGCAASRERGAR